MERRSGYVGVGGLEFGALWYPCDRSGCAKLRRCQAQVWSQFGMGALADISGG